MTKTKYNYFTHINFGEDIIYRFPAKSNTHGLYFSVHLNRWLYCSDRIHLKNWTRISRDKAQKLFPDAFRN